MPRSERSSLWDGLTLAGDLSARSLLSVASNVTLSDLVERSSLGGRLAELRDRSVLIATTDQLATAIALIELDGVARRVVLYPGGLPRDQIPFIIATAEIDALVSDWDPSEARSFDVECVVRCDPGLTTAACDRGVPRQTEWVLLTSGTTGLPKLTVHTLSTLTGAITGGKKSQSAVVWSTFYDIRRYGGLQILLRALLDGGSMMFSSSEESTGDFLSRAGAQGVTHISGTPSHWRRALMSPLAHRMTPKYVRLSGEIVDQAILDNLRACFPAATIVHAFASTEAGVGFDVYDGLAGFPTEIIGQPGAQVEMNIQDGSLRIRSARIGARYLGSESQTLADPDGFVDTGDLVELRGDRYFFVGRRDGVINVGGLKVHPEEIEAVLNRHPHVRMSLVRSRKNPITGSIVVAEVVMESAGDGASPAETAALKRELIEACHRALAPYKVPASIRVVPALDVTSSGKLARIRA